MLAIVTLMMGAWAGVHSAEPPITAIAFAPEGDRVLCTSRNGVAVYRWPELELQKSWKMPWSSVHDVAFSTTYLPDQTCAAVAGGDPSELGGVTIRQWPDGHVLETSKLHDDVAYRVAFSPDGSWLATAGADHAIAISNLKKMPLRQRFNSHSRPVTALAFIDNQFLVTGSVDHSLRVWNVANGQLQRTLENHTAPVTDLALCPSNPKGASPLLASSGEDSTIRFWQPLIGRMVRFARLPSTPMSIVWTSDGQHLIAGCRDGHLRVIDPVQVTITADVAAADGWIYAIALSPDETEVLVGAERGQLVRVPGHTVWKE